MYRAAASAFAAVVCAAMPVLAQENLAFGWISRHPEDKGPPWTKVEIQARFFNKVNRWNLKGAVTVVPGDERLPVLAMTLTGVGPRSNQACTDTERFMWPAQMADISDPAYTNGPRLGKTGDVPVLVVHPARPKAKSIPAASVPAGDVPRKLPRHTVQNAFDLDGDGKADVLYLNWCSDKPASALDACKDSTISRGLFRRAANAWRTLWEDDEC